MARHYLLGLFVLLMCSLLEAAPASATEIDNSENQSEEEETPYKTFPVPAPFFETKKSTPAPTPTLTQAPIERKNKRNRNNSERSDSNRSDSHRSDSRNKALSIDFADNLLELRTITSNLLKLHTRGQKAGRLGSSDKRRLRIQLVALQETISDTIDLIDNVEAKVDVLYNKPVSTRKNVRDDDTDDESEEDSASDEYDLEEDTKHKASGGIPVSVTKRNNEMADKNPKESVIHIHIHSHQHVDTHKHMQRSGYTNDRYDEEYTIPYKT